jgi:hypothetical protein
MRRGWQIEDRYRNTTRDGMPMDETITSFAERVVHLAAKVILDAGGTRAVQGDESVFQIRTEAPENIEPLAHGTGHLGELRTAFREDIETGIRNPVSRRHAARAAYLAICLDMADGYAESDSQAWQAAKEALAGYWKIQQNIFYQADFPTKVRLRERFIAAGFTAPLRRVADEIVWTNPAAWRPAGSVPQKKEAP